MTVGDASLAALLLTNRIVDVGVKPLSAGEFWALVAVLDDPAVLVGMPAADIAATTAIALGDAERCAALLAAGTAFAFERERLEQEGVRLMSALDDAFPQRLRRRLGDACPSFLLVGGPPEALHLRAIGVVGSATATPAALEVATSTARVAAAGGVALVSGLASAVDQTALAAADGGVRVVGVPAEGIRAAARSPEVRRRAHGGGLCLASPYAPGARATAATATGRDKILHALADVTFVVCADAGSGTTWHGAREAIRHGFGRVAVWTGDGAGPGNAGLVELGGVPVSEVGDLLAIDAVEDAPTPADQPSLFD